jgi:glycosyl transferase family 25
LDGQREDLTEKIIETYYDYNPKVYNRKLNFGEIGCMIGHLAAMEKIIKSGSNYGIIFEDDVDIPEDFEDKFNKLFENCPLDFDVISLGSCCGMKHPHASSITNFHRVDPPRSRCGYAQVVSKRTCEVTLKKCIPFNYPADWQIYYITSNEISEPYITYWIEPPLVFEGSKNNKYISCIR